MTFLLISVMLQAHAMNVMQGMQVQACTNSCIKGSVNFCGQKLDRRSLLQPQGLKLAESSKLKARSIQELVTCAIVDAGYSMVCTSLEINVCIPDLELHAWIISDFGCRSMLPPFAWHS